MPKLWWKGRSWLALTGLLGACTPGLSGQALVRLTSGGIGNPIGSVQLTFVREDGLQVRTASTAASGRYSIDLPAARYYVRATHPQFEDDSSAPGLSVVSGTGHRTMNVFLHEPQTTVALIVRHGEKQNPASNDPAEPLSTAGAARANLLRDLLFRAGISAIYSTDTVRTRSTVEPLRQKLQLTTTTYATASEVAQAILADHAGDVVLVAAHGDTAAGVANALGGTVGTATIGDFDNLYVVSRSGSSTRVVNLQYGLDSTPDIDKNSGSLLSLLLVRQVSGSNPPEADRLRHACGKAGLSSIHVDGGTALVQPLATALGLAPQAFTSTTLDSVVDGIVASPPAGPVMIVGSRDELRQVITRTGAHPAPILYDTDRNNLLLVTRSTTGARAVSLLY